MHTPSASLLRMHTLHISMVGLFFSLPLLLCCTAAVVSIQAGAQQLTSCLVRVPAGTLLLLAYATPWHGLACRRRCLHIVSALARSRNQE